MSIAFDGSTIAGFYPGACEASPPSRARVLPSGSTTCAGSTPVKYSPGHLRESGAMPPIVSIVGNSGVGKTTLLEKLIAELTARGYCVGTVKHDVHDFDIDHEGKDSWRHKRAGAHTVVISSPVKLAVVKDAEREETLDSLASKYFQDVDLILTEGFKKEDKPKIEVFCSQMHETPLLGRVGHLAALVSDTTLDLGVPRFDLDDIRGLADLVEKRFLSKR